MTAQPSPVRIQRVDPACEAARALIEQSDRYMESLYPPESNHLESAEALKLPNVAFFGGYIDGELVACGAVKILDDDGCYGEIKRVFVIEAQRGKGLSKAVMARLERHLKESNVAIARLETGIRQPEALGLYRRLNYVFREPFGSYRHDPLSVFMEKPVRIGESMTAAEEVVQRQLDAWNAKDVDAWLSTYAPDAQQFELHGGLLAAGHEAMRERILVRFAEPDLHARLLARTVMGDIVVDHERITRNFPEGRGTLEMLCVYEIGSGVIRKATFAIGAKTLESGGKGAG